MHAEVLDEYLKMLHTYGMTKPWYIFFNIFNGGYKNIKFIIQI